MILGIQLMCCATDDQEALEQNRLLGTPIPDESVKRIPVTFWTIDNVEPIDDEYCLIRSGGAEYTVAENYKRVNAKISERMIFKLN